MTRQQPVDYALVEFRPNPARPTEGRLLLAIVFACKMGQLSVLGSRWRVGIPNIEIEKLDPLARELFEHRKSTLKAELDSAMQDAREPAQVLARLAANNPWSFHIGKPVSAKVERFDPAKMGLEDWAHDWTRNATPDPKRPHTPSASHARAVSGANSGPGAGVCAPWAASQPSIGRTAHARAAAHTS